MKNFLSYFAALVLIFSAAACGDDKNEPGGSGIPSDFKCNPTELSFPMGGGDAVLTVVADTKPEVTASETWVTVGETQVQGSQKNIYKITLTASANPEGNYRSATALVKAGKNTAEVSLSQTAKPMMDVDPESLAAAQEPFPSEGGSRSVVITYNLEYEAEATAPWITIDATRALQQGEVRFSVAANNSPSQRTGSIVITPKSPAVSPVTITVTQDSGEAQPLLNKNAMEIAADIFAGINIGNTLEAPGSETGWGNPKVNEQYIQGLKDAGFNAVRVPCAWDSHVTDAENNIIDPAWLDRVYEVVGWITERDMYAIVNIHWDGGWLEDNINEESLPTVLPKQKAYWKQIAEKLGGFNERLLFAGTNEPYQSRQGEFGAKEMNVLLQYEQAFVDVVRATGGNNLVRTLVFQGPATNIDLTASLMTSIPTDVAEDRLMAEIHYYDPWNFCGMDKDESWGIMSFYWGSQNFADGSDRNSTWGDESYMKAQFDKMKKQFVDKGIPVVIGEYGAIVDHSSMQGVNKEKALASRAYFDRCVSEFGKERGLVPFLWDTGEIFSRATGAVKMPDIVEGIMEGSRAGRYPF